MRWVYLSPHLDDAVLSAGGWIHKMAGRGDRVEIWTVISGFPPHGELTPLAELLHSQWESGSAEDTVRMRREEDSRAASLLGAGTFHFDIPDCIYRRGPGGEALYSNVFVEPHPDEIGLPAGIAARLSELLRPDDQVICQFAIGGHVDHILVRQAAEMLARPLLYAADLPYHFRHPAELKAQISGKVVILQALAEEDLQAWAKAIVIYRSQLSSLFENLEQIEPEVRMFCLEWGGFPLWGSV